MRTLLALLLLTAATLPAEPLLPTAVGTTWEYEVKDSAAPAAIGSSVVRAVGTERIADVDAVKLETTTSGDVSKTELVTVNERGVFCYRRTSSDGKVVTFDPPQTVVPAQLAVGTKWELDDEVHGSAMHQEFTVAAEEEVTVPAGKFRAWRYQCARPWPLSARVERWFTPGVGLVKETTQTHGPTGRLLQRVTRSLKHFSRGESSAAAATAPVVTESASDTAVSLELGSGPPVPSVSIASNPRVLLQVSRVRDGEPVTQFRAHAPGIFVRWSGEDLPVRSVVRIAWIAEDVGDLVEPNFVVDETETEITAPEFGGRFTLSRPPDGWAPGKYRLELYLGDALLETVRVQIAE
jgi:hypothetical protein